MDKNKTRLTFSHFSVKSTCLVAAFVAGFGLSSQKAQAKPSGEGALRASSGEMLRGAEINYGFDVQCGLERGGRADLWKRDQHQQAVVFAGGNNACSVVGDQGAANFRCYCAHQVQSLAGEIDASKIPSLSSSREVDKMITRSALIGLCEETFHAQCGPLVEPLVAECGVPTESYCRVSLRGDLKNGGYNLFEESCLCNGASIWSSSQRLSTPLGTPSTSAKERCQTQIDACRRQGGPSFDPVQMMNVKGYTRQKVSCASVKAPERSVCYVNPSEDGQRVEYACDCDGGESGGSVSKTVALGAKTLHEACTALLQRECSEPEDSDDDADEFDTSSADDDEGESAETSSADDGTDSDDDDDFNPKEEPTETGPGEEGPQPNPGDVLDSLGCRTQRGGAGGWSVALSLGLLGLLGWRSSRGKLGRST